MKKKRAASPRLLPDVARSGPPRLAWIDAARDIHHELAQPGVMSARFHEARISRRVFKYRNKRNYEGRYWFSRSMSHVWHESMTEYSALMRLDFLGRVASVSSQPMRIDFGDGTCHFPDYFALGDDGTQTLIDVRPAELLDEAAAETFAKTALVCEHIGWSYEVMGSIDRVNRHTLEWLAAYRHRRYRPGADYTSWLREHTATPTTLGELIADASAADFPHRQSGLFSLMWHGEIRFSWAGPLSEATEVWSGTDA